MRKEKDDENGRALGLMGFRTDAVVGIEPGKEEKMLTPTPNLRQTARLS